MVERNTLCIRQFPNEKNCPVLFIKLLSSIVVNRNTLNALYSLARGWRSRWRFVKSGRERDDIARSLNGQPARKSTFTRASLEINKHAHDTQDCRVRANAHCVRSRTYAGRVSISPLSHVFRDRVDHPASPSRKYARTICTRTYIYACGTNGIYGVFRKRWRKSNLIFRKIVFSLFFLQKLKIKHVHSRAFKRIWRCEYLAKILRYITLLFTRHLFYRHSCDETRARCFVHRIIFSNTMQIYEAIIIFLCYLLFFFSIFCYF